jgi:hypothetical protein
MGDQRQENAKFGFVHADLIAGNISRAGNGRITGAGSFPLVRRPDVGVIKRAVREAARFYAKLSDGTSCSLDVEAASVDYDGSWPSTAPWLRSSTPGM